ncbi:MAG: hypothetical protein HGB19_12055, partial [Chlorobiales bacterium]|nr:hypothetical protein [Chlorobiales bacterium]
SGKSFRSTLHFEKDNLQGERLSGFYSLFNQEEYAKTRNHTDARDLKFWDEIPFGRSKIYTIEIPSPDPNVSSDPESLRVIAAFHGLSMVNLGGLPQNTVRIAIGSQSNPIIAGESSWGTSVGTNNSHQDVHVVNVRLPITEQRLFDKEGSGVIQISNRDKISIGTSSRVFLFNWLNLTYRRLYRANNNQLTFTAPPSSRPGTYQFEIIGFTTPEIEVYKEGVGKLTNFITERYEEEDPNASGKVLYFYRAVFQDDIVNPENVKYIAVSSSDKKLPLRYEKVGPSNLFEQSVTLRDKSNDYNFIIITSDNFINEDTYQSLDNAVRLYKEYRETTLPRFGESGRVLVATVKSIYDEFNNGIKSPHAIRDFLDYAYHEWQIPPTYILLLGDASRTVAADDLVPTMDVQTIRYGAAAADAWFVMVDGIDESGQLDLLPDMQISRVPVRTSGDIKAYLEKLQVYESQANSNTGQWKNTIVIVGGETGNESIGSSGVRRDIFITQEDGLANDYINRNYFIKRLNTNKGRNAQSGNPTDIFIGGRADMQQMLNDGCLIATFMGHGGGATWSDSQILTLGGIDNLNNFNARPFFTSMTCYTGAFDESRFFSQGGTLSEKLILTKGKGGIGTIGSSGVGWLINDELMARSIYKFMLSEEYQGLSIADMLFRAKIEYYLDNIYRWEQAPSMIYQYGVFGDPALRLAIPKEKNSVGDPVIRWNLVSHIAKPGDTLKVMATVDGITTGTGYGQLSDTKNLDVSSDPQFSFTIQNGKFYQSRNGRLSDTLMVRISQPIAITTTNVETFSGGQFKVYVYGTGTDAGKDANGHVAFSTAGAVIHDVEPSPKLDVAINQAVHFTLGVDSREVVNPVAVAIKLESPKDGLTYGQVPGWDYHKLTTTEVSKGVFTTQESIPASLMSKGTRVTYYADALTGSGKYSRTAEKTVIVGELPDVAIYKQAQSGLIQFYDNSSIGLYSKDNKVVVGAEIYNWSNVDADKVIVKFYENSISNGDPKRYTKPVLTSNNLIGTATISIPAGQKVLATIPAPSSFKLSSTYKIG